jgi:chemotaxis protein histidine kinase CheA
MAEIRDFIDNEISRKIRDIEKKLKEAFSFIKKDILEIKSSLAKPNKEEIEALKKELEELKKEKEIKQAIASEQKKVEQLTQELSEQKEKEKLSAEEQRLRKSLEEKYNNAYSNLEKEQKKFGEHISELITRHDETFSKILRDNSRRFENLFRELEEKRAHETKLLLREISAMRESYAESKEALQEELSELKTELEQRRRALEKKREAVQEKPGFWARLFGREEKEKLEKPAKPEKTKLEFEISRPKLKKALKIIIALIPLILIGYIVYANFLVSHDFVYFYDIGSDKDAKTTYLTPIGRTSDVFVGDDDVTTYRNITGNPVYFNVSIPRGSNNLTVEAKFNVKDLKAVSLAVKNSQNLTYGYQKIYIQNSSAKNLTIEFTNSSSYQIKDLYIKDNKVTFMMGASELNKENTTSALSIDWIKTTVHKNGIF